MNLALLEDFGKIYSLLWASVSSVNGMYLFPKAAVTNNRKLGDLKQEFILSQFQG